MTTSKSGTAGRPRINAEKTMARFPEGTLGRIKAVLRDGENQSDFMREADWFRSEEHTSELQSLMRISYAVFCLKKKKKHIQTHQCTRHTVLHRLSVATAELTRY